MGGGLGDGPERFRMLVQLATWTSLRLDELAALARADIDLLHGTVKVSKNRQRLDDGTSVVVIPKSVSPAGRRTVSIPPPPATASASPKPPAARG